MDRAHSLPRKRTIDLFKDDYAEIIRFAESHGYRRSREALAREAEEGAIGQYGLTLDEACTFIKARGLNG